jgi:hypothetical protein
MTGWSDFTEEVEKGSSGKAPGCTLGNWLKRAPAKTREVVEAALVRPELTTTVIARAIRSRDDSAQVSDFTVRRHRRGDCSCKKNG